MDFIFSIFHILTAYAAQVANPPLPPAAGAPIPTIAPLEGILGFYNIALLAAGGLALASLIIGVIQYLASSGDTSKKSDSRDRLTQAFLGILLLLGIYVVLNVINPDLTNLTLPNIEPIRQTVGPSYGLADPGAILENENNVRRRLELSGVTVNAGPSQTQVAGLRTETIQEAILLQGSCKCGIVITGGNEQGHAAGDASHAGGYKIDVRSTTELNAYIANPANFTRIADRSPGIPQYQSKTGAIYVREGDHWDIVINH